MILSILPVFHFIRFSGETVTTYICAEDASPVVVLVVVTATQKPQCLSELCLSQEFGWRR